MIGEVVAQGKHSAVTQEAGNTAGAKHAAVRVPTRGRVAAIVAVTVVGVLTLAYLVGVAVFANVLFVPGISINGEDVSLRNMGEVAAEHSARAGDYTLAVTGQGLDFTVPAATIELTFDGAAYVAAAQSQLNAWFWPALTLTPRDLTVETVATFNEAKVARLVGSAVDTLNDTATPPTEAEVTFDDKTGRYVVSGGVAGTQLDATAVTDVVSGALRALETRVRITGEQLAMPKLTADDEALNAEAKMLNRYVGATQTLTVAGSEVHTIDGTQIAQWLTIGDDVSVSVNGDAITAWAKGPLSERLDTVGTTRAYTRADGKAVSVGGGSYGWSIDGATLAATLVVNIEAGTAATVEVPMLQSAAAWNPGGVDWGARYIDIDLAEQHVRLYDDGGALVWESACVSGKTADGHDTPTGVYAINANMTSGNVELRGLIDPATNEPEYISYVTYWMPFVDNAIALHDASWRGTFGGTIYQGSGSHGCVNLPTDAAASLYGMVRVGDVVVVHW